MRLKMVRLENYAGILNGMGLYEIEIDFSKCQHNMLIIKGDNGSGKSTLFKTLKPLPDDSDSFIPGRPARKVIEYFGDMNEIYQLEFIHEVKTNGERSNTKGYFRKNIGMGFEELNANGNITSCKDLIYSELKLDPNFVALSQLSTDDRGLADKKPAERKKFVNSIISSVEVYNNIYKTLAKRSSIFKSMINSINSKIDTLGDPEKINNELISAENRLEKLEASYNSVSEKIAYYKSAIDHIDPDKSIRISYDSLLQDESMCIESKTLYNQKYISLAKDINTDGLSNIDYYTKIQKDKDKMNMTIESLDKEATKLLSDIDDKSKLLQDKIAKLNAIQSDGNIKDLQSRIVELETTIKECESIFKKLDIKDGCILTKDEYVMGINTLINIKEMVDSFEEEFSLDIAREALKILGAVSIDRGIEYPDTSIELHIINLQDILMNLTNEYNEASILNKMADKLSIRPEGCKIDSCGFIKDAVDAMNTLRKRPLEVIEDEILKINKDINSAEMELARNRKIIEAINKMKTIYRNIDNCSSILNKLPIANIVSDKNSLINRIFNGEPLTELNYIYRDLQYANIFEDYKYAKDNITILKSEYKALESKTELVDSILADIDTLNADVDNMSLYLQDIRDKKTSSMSMIDQYDNILNKVSVIIDIENKCKTAEAKLDEVIKAKNTISDNMNKIERYISDINVASAEANSIKTEMNNLYIVRDELKYKLQSIRDYDNELIEYKSMYEKIEVIKFYSSPTTGIQTLFMELYMNKIITLANKLLAMIFEGTFKLEPFIINETEFRIPCSGGMLLHDDISSMSSSQVACISMILSFALLFQSSSKLNILKLDEIDGALDSTNRRNFIIMLEDMLKILECQQCIIISHNDELNLNNCDVVVLKHTNIEPIDGNIIWQY